jgi:hypothetical protein
MYPVHDYQNIHHSGVPDAAMLLENLSDGMQSVIELIYATTRVKTLLTLCYTKWMLTGVNPGDTSHVMSYHESKFDGSTEPTARCHARSWRQLT